MDLLGSYFHNHGSYAIQFGFCVSWIDSHTIFIFFLAEFPALATLFGFNRTRIGGVHLQLCTFSAIGALSTIGYTSHGFFDLESLLHTFLISTLLAILEFSGLEPSLT